MTIRGYTLAVDWSGGGNFLNAYEDVSSGGRVQDGEIEISWGRAIEPGGEVTLKSAVGQFAFALNNRDRVFSPENTSSVLTGDILPGRAVQFRKLSPTGQLFTLLAGVLDSFTVDSDTARTFTGNVLDGWATPGAVKLSTPLYSSIRTGAAINLVLDAAGWTGPRDIDPGATVMPWWWEENTDAAAAVEKIVASEGAPAIAGVEGGTFVFRDRHHRLFDARSLNSQGTFTHIEPAGSGPLGDFKMERGTWEYDHGTRNIFNIATFSVDIRAPGSVQEVWASEDPVSLASGQVLTLTVETSDPFFNAQTPVVGSDVILAAGSLSSVTLSRTSGQSAVLTITCSATAIITRIALRGVSVPVVRTIQVSARDQSSIGLFRQQNWPDNDSPVWAGQYDAQVIANRIVALYANYRPVVTFTIYAINDAYLTKLLDLKISDRITVRHDPTGVNGAFMVEKIAHKVTKLQQHRVALTCVAAEPTQPVSVFTYNVAGLGFNDGRFGVDGIDNAAAIFRFDTAGQGFSQGVFAN